MINLNKPITNEEIQEFNKLLEDHWFKIYIILDRYLSAVPAYRDNGAGRPAQAGNEERKEKNGD